MRKSISSCCWFWLVNKVPNEPTCVFTPNLTGRKTKSASQTNLDAVVLFFLPHLHHVFQQQHTETKHTTTNTHRSSSFQHPFVVVIAVVGLERHHHRLFRSRSLCFHTYHTFFVLNIPSPPLGFTTTHPKREGQSKERKTLLIIRLDKLYQHRRKKKDFPNILENGQIYPNSTRCNTVMCFFVHI